LLSRRHYVTRADLRRKVKEAESGVALFREGGLTV
jgi:hypothetical protein